MRNFFMDESGSLGFAPGGTQFFVITTLTPEDGKALNRKMKNINGHLISNGWNKDVEIKASNVWMAGNNKDIPANYKYKNNQNAPMEYILNEIASQDLSVAYTAIKLDTVPAHLRTVHKCILFSDYASRMITEPFCMCDDIQLYVDRRNTERHDQLKFDGVIERDIALERAKRNMKPLNLSIQHYHWNSALHCANPVEKGVIEFGIRGIEAADFVCWAIKARFENGNSKWYQMIRHRVKWSQHLDFDEKAYK